jgi:hypothetical protein
MPSKAARARANARKASAGLPLTLTMADQKKPKADMTFEEVDDLQAFHAVLRVGM